MYLFRKPLILAFIHQFPIMCVFFFSELERGKICLHVSEKQSYYIVDHFWTEVMRHLSFKSAPIKQSFCLNNYLTCKTIYHFSRFFRGITINKTKKARIGVAISFIYTLYLGLHRNWFYFVSSLVLMIEKGILKSFFFFNYEPLRPDPGPMFYFDSLVHIINLYKFYFLSIMHKQTSMGKYKVCLYGIL